MKNYAKILFTLLLCAGTAHAESGLYLGAGLGQARTDISGLTSDTDVAWSGFAGFMMNKNLAIEADYVNLGEIKAGTNKATSSGVAGTLVGILPLQGNAAVYGKFGLASISTKWDSGNASRSDLTWGVGGQLDFSSLNSVRVEYDSYSVGDKDKANMHGNTGVFMLGILFRL